MGHFYKNQMHSKAHCRTKITKFHFANFCQFIWIFPNSLLTVGSDPTIDGQNINNKYYYWVYYFSSFKKKKRFKISYFSSMNIHFAILKNTNQCLSFSFAFVVDNRWRFSSWVVFIKCTIKHNFTFKVTKNYCKTEWYFSH